MDVKDVKLTTVFRGSDGLIYFHMYSFLKELA